MQTQEAPQVFNFANYAGPVPGVEDREKLLKLSRGKEALPVQKPERLQSFRDILGIAVSEQKMQNQLPVTTTVQ